MEDKIKEFEVKVENTDKLVAEKEEEKKEELTEKKTTKKKTTTKKKATKKTEEEEEEKKVEGLELTPEMMEMFKKFMESQQKAAEPKTQKNVDEKFTKAKLYGIKDEIVPVRNILDGKVIYVSPKTKIKYKWLEKGDIEYLSIEEVLAMDSKKLYLRTPLLIVEDERIIEGLGLKKLYKDIELVENIDELIELEEEEIERIIKGLSVGCKNNLRDEVNKKIKNCEIRDYMIVNMLKRLLDL
jgi:hypothetical protein